MTDLINNENIEIRKIEHNGEWFFSVVDVVNLLVESKAKDKGAYWRKLKGRLNLKEKSEIVTKCHELKLLSSDGKKYLTDCANTETMFRIIQSIPSPNAEPIKLWLARVGYERIQEIENPELAQERMMEVYRQKGYDEAWIRNRIQTIRNRKELTNEWDLRGATEEDYAIFTSIMSLATFGIKPSEHKKLKGLKRENLRDNMTDMELTLANLGELTAKEIHKSNNTQGKENLQIDVLEAGKIAGNTRLEIEKKIGKSIVSKDNYLNSENKKKLS